MAKGDTKGQVLRKRGFDLTKYCPRTGTYRIGCSSCQAVVINGIACHEHSCPRKRRYDG